MRKKAPFKVLSSLTIATLIGCSAVMSAPLAYAETPAKESVSTTPIDEHLIQEDRLAEALKQRGVIDPASLKQRRKRLSRNMLRKRKGKTLVKKSCRDSLTQEASDFMKKVKDAKNEENEQASSQQ